jgi:colicin import membrane protein
LTHLDDCRDQLLPTHEKGARQRGIVFSLIAHALLIAALAIGVQWKASEPTGSEAELWAAVPQQAVPQAEVVVPPPPVVKPPPVPPKTPPPTQPDPAVQAQRDAQIAVEKEKARKDKEKKEEEFQERKEREKALEREQEKQKEKEREKDKDKQKKEQLAKEQQLEKVRLEKQAQELKKEEQRAEVQREAQMKRILNQAGAAGSNSGGADRTAGPSSGYAGKIKALIRPNVLLSNEVEGNPVAEVEVRVAPDGAIIGRRLTKSSGVREWDDTVLRAIDRTERIPRDTDGRVVSPMVLVFKRQDY